MTDYEWECKKDKEDKSGTDVSLKVPEIAGNQQDSIDPYGDWDAFKSSQVNSGKSSDGKLQREIPTFFPIFVRLNNKIENAPWKFFECLLNPEKTGIFITDTHFKTFVKQFTAKDNSERSLSDSFFILRKSDKSFEIPVFDDEELFEIVLVGARFKQSELDVFAKTDDLKDAQTVFAPTSAAQKLSTNPTTQHSEKSFVRAESDGKSLDEAIPVVTAVIDDVVGIANSRFCRIGADGKLESRVEHFMIPSTGFGGLGEGEGLTSLYLSKQDITDKLADLGGEHAFYEDTFPQGAAKGKRFYQMRLGGYGQPFGFRATHGTHVLDLAAGYDPVNALDDRPIYYIQLPQIASAESWGSRLDYYILTGVMQTILWADAPEKKHPLVINISYATFAGPKNGKGFLEHELKRLVEARNAQGIPTEIVISAGNSYRAQCHAEASLKECESEYVIWRVQPEDQSVSFLEIWLENLEKVEITISPPAGAPKTFELGKDERPIFDWKVSKDCTNCTIGRVSVKKEAGFTRVTFALMPTLNHQSPDLIAPAGGYKVEVKNLDETKLDNVRFESQRDDTPTNFPRYGRQAYLDHPTLTQLDTETLQYNISSSDQRQYNTKLKVGRGFRGPLSRKGTLSPYATSSSDHIYVVGAAYGFSERFKESRATLYTSEAGKGAKAVPKCAAIGDDAISHPGVLASGTYSGSTTALGGTSVAAPQITRMRVDELSNHAAKDGNPAGPSMKRRLGTKIFRGTDENRKSRIWHNPESEKGVG